MLVRVRLDLNAPFAEKDRARDKIGTPMMAITRRNAIPEGKTTFVLDEATPFGNE